MIISNSSPLILLSKINRVELFRELYGKIFIANAVQAEVIEKGKKEHYSDAFIVEKYVGNFIFVKEVVKSEELSKLKSALGAGEAESIVLCKQEHAEMLIIDDWKSRKIAESEGIRCKSTLGVLFEALQKNKMTLDEYEQSIKKLAQSAWISGDIVAEFLQAAYKLRGGKNEI
ncbi:MAG: hypothetical protein WC613_05975 [Candidatus Aenigmatarchaeota archaeon]